MENNLFFQGDDLPVGGRWQGPEGHVNSPDAGIHQKNANSTPGLFLGPPKAAWDPPHQSSAGQSWEPPYPSLPPSDAWAPICATFVLLMMSLGKYLSSSPLPFPPFSFFSPFLAPFFLLPPSPPPSPILHR